MSTKFSRNWTAFVLGCTSAEVNPQTASTRRSSSFQFQTNRASTSYYNNSGNISAEQVTEMQLNDQKFSITKEFKPEFIRYKDGLATKKLYQGLRFTNGSNKLRTNFSSILRNQAKQRESNSFKSTNSERSSRSSAITQTFFKIFST